MRTLLLAIAAILVSSSASAQGTVLGSVAEKGGPLSGVAVTLKGPNGEVKATTGGDGRYQFADLPAGRYTITAALPGFAEMGPDGRAVVDQTVEITERVAVTRDLLMMPVVTQVTWAIPADGLRGLYQEADVVARLRIDHSDRPPRHRQMRQTATVSERFKWNPALGAPKDTIAFQQEMFLSDEQAVYPAGQDLVVFLRYRDGDFYRICGAYGAFLFDHGRVQTHSRPAGEPQLDGLFVADFLSQLRAIAAAR